MYNSVLMAVVFVAGYLILAQIVSLHRASLLALKQSNASYSGVSSTGTLEEFKQEEQDLIKENALLGSWIDRRVYWTLKMNEIAKQSAGGIRLSLLNYQNLLDREGNSMISLRMQGIVVSNDSGNELETINRFLSALREDAVFMQGLNDIKLYSLNKNTIAGQPVTNFILDCSSQKR